MSENPLHDLRRTPAQPQTRESGSPAGLRRRAGLAPVTDPVASAKAAGLRYVTDTGPGIRRRRAGGGFTYIGVDGRAIHAPEELRRIRSLAIPPAWRDVWICPTPSGHLQATGRDARGRKQYRYHRRWREVRDETKYDRLISFGRSLPLIRQQTERDLTLPGLPRRKVLATLVRLLERTLIRIGNEEYVRQNRSFGLTTMRDHHVNVSGARLKFRFRGKSGVTQEVAIADSRLAAIVRRCQDLPGQELFQYVDEHGERQTIESSDVNAYLREITGQDFTAKEFRTWAGTVLAVRIFQEFKRADSKSQAKRNVIRAIEAVAKRLGNTRAVCRKCYVHPAVITAYTDGSLLFRRGQHIDQAMTRASQAWLPGEDAVLELLCRAARRET